MAVASLAVAAAAGCRTQARAPHRDDLFHRIAALCGREIEGRADFIAEPRPDDPFQGARLLVKVASCSEREIRMPLAVGEDRSRTWILTRQPAGLRLKHDHRHADGSADAITDYGGDAEPTGGTSLHVRFPADAHTARLIPPAATNVWALELRPRERQLLYVLERHGKLRFRAVFDLPPP